MKIKWIEFQSVINTCKKAKMSVSNETIEDIIADNADSSCNTGFNTTGSSVFDIFNNGFDLANKAHENHVVGIEVGEQYHFFICKTTSYVNEVSIKILNALKRKK